MQYLLILCSALLALFSLYKDWHNYKHPRLRKAVAVVVLIVAALSAYKQRTDSINAQATKNKLTADINTLESQVAELNNTATGGDGFCYVQFPRDTKQSGGTPVVMNKGSFSLYGLQARFVDLSKAKKTGILSPLDGGFNIPELFGNKAAYFTTGTIPFTDPNAQDFNVFFTARNGSWTQLLRLRWVGGIWQYATRVLIDQSQAHHVKNPVFESISPNYPRTATGEVDWRTEFTSPPTIR